MKLSRNAIKLLCALVYLAFSVDCTVYPSIQWEPNNPK